MDDKDDSYNKSYPPKPSLPPFSSLRARTFVPDGGFNASEPSSGYGTSSSFQQQEQLYSFNSHLQGSSYFHQQPQAVDFPRQATAVGLQRDNRPSHLSNSQPSSFHGSLTPGSHFQVRNQSQLLDILQQPPIPDMSLSLPFTAVQPGLLGNSQLPMGIQNFSVSSLFSSNTDHPPQIPLSQVESLLSEAEQKSISEFSTLPQTLDAHNISSSWQSSYSSVPIQSSEELPSFSDFSSFNSRTSSNLTNTKDTHLPLESPSKASERNFYQQQCFTPESSNRFTPSTSLLPGYAASQYQPSYPGNYFLPKPDNMNSRGIPYSDFSEIQNMQGEKKFMRHNSVQNNQLSFGSVSCDVRGIMPQKANSVVTEQMSAVTKGNQKGRKKKKLSEKSLDMEVKILTSKKKSKTSKKSKSLSRQESSVSLPSMAKDNDSASASFCLSPTFIASLSSKRAADALHLSDVSHTGSCYTEQDHMPQRSNSIQSAPSDTHQNYENPSSSASYFGASASCQSIPQMCSNNQSFKVMGYQMSYPLVSSSSCPSVQSVCQRSDSKHPPTNIPTPSKKKFNEVLKAETEEEEERSLSPFQLSPGFIASLSSKRAEEHVQHSLMETTSVMESSLKSHSKSLSGMDFGSKHQFPRQQVQASVSLSANHVSVNNTYSESPSSITPTSYVKQVSLPHRIQLLNSSESDTSQKSSSQQCSVSQEFKHENILKHVSSPKQYVSPPSYSQTSEFQYPTPPMEEDEGKLQSPGLYLSPTFLGSLSNKVASDELSHRLSPINDDNVSVLPTPPNSAGPKQSSIPDITLSKEEQTSRILEIIAREREKVSTVSQISSLEPKKKKKKKKSKEIGNTDYGSRMTNVQVPTQMDQQSLLYCSEVPKDIEHHHPYQKYPGTLLTKSVSGSISGHTNSLMKLANNPVFPDDKVHEIPVNFQFHHKDLQHHIVCPENDCDKFDLKQNKSFYLDNSDCVKTGVICNDNESFHRLTMEGQSNAEVNALNEQEQYRDSYAGSSQSISGVNQFSLRRPYPVHGPKSSDEEHVMIDPYAFDDSEHVDLNSSLSRSMKNVSNLPYTTKVKQLDTRPVSHLLFTAESKSPPSKSVQHSRPTYFPPVSKSSPLDHIPTAGNFQTADTLPKGDNHIPWDRINHIQGNRQLQPGKILIKSEMSPSPTNHEYNPNISQQVENLHKPNIVNSTSVALTANHQQMQDNNSFKTESILSFSSESTGIKQEFQNLPHSMDHMMDYHKSFSYSFDTKNEIKGSAALEIVKKKRGRPPKFMSASISSPVKPKVPKLKLNEKKLKVQTPTKIVYKMNGTEVKPSDLTLNQNLVDRLANNLMEVADCSCLGPDHVPSESTEGPYYTQLGAARDIPGVRKVLEQRTSMSGSAIRIEKVIFTGKEGRSKEGCPIAKWIIRRSGPEEKYLCIVRKRPGHFCDTAVIIMVIVAWEGVDRCQADTLYDFLIGTLPQNGIETDRRCGLNEKKTCACQGVDLLRRGASFSFGCSWSMYYNGCKFARSQIARKFKLKNPDYEEELEDKLQKLATDVAPLYSRLAPDAFRNQVQFESQAKDCRLGGKPGQPFSGVTAVVDFCCHSHRDCHNMNNGSTVVVNLTKHREFEKPDDEQYHVLPLYILDQTDELGSMEGQMAKVQNGSLEVLSRYMTEVRKRSTPYRPCKRNRTAPKRQGLKKNTKKSKLIKAKSLTPDEPFPKSESSSFSEDAFFVPQSQSMDKMNATFKPGLAVNIVPGVGLDDRNEESMTYTDLMSQQGLPGFRDLYTQFWDFFYTHGEFPPCEWMSKKRFTATAKAVRSSFTSNTLIQPSAADQMLLHQQQQWQHQEQRKLQQLNVQVPAAQPQQPEKHRQQNLHSSFTGKQGFQPSSSIHSTYRSISPRQHHHAHNYQCETSVPVTLQTSSQSFLHSSSVTQKKQQCIPTPLPSSIPLTSSKLQQSHSSEPPPSASNQSHLIASTSQYQQLETGISNISHSDIAHEDNNIICVHPTSQNSHIYSQSTALMSRVSSGGCDKNHTKYPPTYHQSISNQHNMQCGPQEALCSFKPQGPPPSYDDSLAQSAHSSKLNNSQEDIIMRFSSNHPVGETQLGSQSHPFSQSTQYSNDSNAIPRSPSAQLVEGPIFAQGVQKSSLYSESLERPPSAQSRLRSPSAMSISRALSSQSEGQNSEFQRPPSAQSTSRPSSAMSVERPASVQFIPRNCQSSVQTTSMSGLAQTPHAILTGEPHSTNKRPSSVPRPSSEHSGSSFQFMERNYFSKSVDVSQHSQKEHRPPSGHLADLLPIPQVVPISEPCNISQQHYYQTTSQRTDSSTPKSRVGKVVSDSLNFTRRLESSVSGAATYSLDNKQAKIVRERCWSSMSEPSSRAEIARPSSCYSEPSLLSGWKKELPYSLEASDTGKYNIETQSCTGLNSLHASLDNARIVKSEDIYTPQDAEKSELKNTDLLVKQESASLMKEPSCFTQSGVIEQCGQNYSHTSYIRENESGKKSLLPASFSAPIFEKNLSENPLSCNSAMPLLARSSNLESTPRMTSTLVSESANNSIPKEVSYNGLFVNGPVGNVCSNGPIIGEKIKVHKSEGFIVPKLGHGPSEPPYEVIDSTVASVETDDNLEAFNDPAMGGVAIALCHGAVLFEVAKRELHATTALKEPNRYQPKRISLVFYQHKNLNLSRHGFDEYEKKTEERRNQAEQARLIEEMESKGFLKGELSELASFPKLTKGTFGKVFNFPESQKTLFPLHFPRYLDSSHSEYITPVMFACMSIAFPTYMKEAFPNPSSLPRLMSGLMPVRMHSSLSDKRKDFKHAHSEVDNKSSQCLVDIFEKCTGTFQKALCPWKPIIPQGNTMTTNSVITRWVHDDVIVTGPYNRWVELGLQIAIKKREMNVEVESEADLKEKMFDSVSQLDHEVYVSSSHLCSDAFHYAESNIKTEPEHSDNSNSSTTTVVKSQDSDSTSNMEHSSIYGGSCKKGVQLKQSSVDSVNHNKVSVEAETVPRVMNYSSEFSPDEVTEAANKRLEITDYNDAHQGRIPQQDCQNGSFSVVMGKSDAAEKADMLAVASFDSSLRNGGVVPEVNKDQLVHSVPEYNLGSNKTDFRLSKIFALVDEPRIHNDLLRKSATKDVNLNLADTEWSCQSDAKKNAPLHIPSSNSVLVTPANRTDMEKCTTNMENNRESIVSKKQESVYDFLIKGFNRSFLSNQPNSAQSMHDELTYSTHNECP